MITLDQNEGSFGSNRCFAHRFLHCGRRCSRSLSVTLAAAALAQLDQMLFI
jgi:hypothetical protein